MANTSGWKAFLMGSGPEADIGLRDVVSDPCAVLLILGAMLLALLA